MTEEKKKKYKNNNYRKIVSFLNERFPERNITDFCDVFGYKEHIKGLLTLEEDEFKEKFKTEYECLTKSFDKKRMDFRTPFETARDICSNFIMEDFLLHTINQTFPDLSISLNEEENRDIEEKVTSLPDFVYKNDDTGSKIRFDLKIDWSGKSIKKRKYFFRGNEDSEYKKYQAAALIWCPKINRFTFVDFRGNVDGERGTDETKGGKEGFWADLSKNVFDEIYFGKNTYINEMVKQLDKLSRKKY